MLLPCEPGQVACTCTCRRTCTCTCTCTGANTADLPLALLLPHLLRYRLAQLKRCQSTTYHLPSPRCRLTSCSTCAPSQWCTAPPTTYQPPLTNLAQYLLLDSWPSDPDPNLSPDPNANLVTLLPLVGALPATRPILPARRRAAAARNTPLLRHAAAQALPQPDSNPNPGRKPGTYFLPSPSPSSNLNPNDDPT